MSLEQRSSKMQSDISRHGKDLAATFTRDMQIIMRSLGSRRLDPASAMAVERMRAFQGNEFQKIQETLDNTMSEYVTLGQRIDSGDLEGPQAKEALTQLGQKFQSQGKQMGGRVHQVRESTRSLLQGTNDPSISLPARKIDANLEEWYGSHARAFSTLRHEFTKHIDGPALSSLSESALPAGDTTPGLSPDVEIPAF